MLHKKSISQKRPLMQRRVVLQFFYYCVYISIGVGLSELFVVLFSSQISVAYQGTDPVLSLLQDH